MRRPHRLAALRALKYAIGQVEAAESAAVLAEADATGADRWKTPFGTVNVVRRSGWRIDDDAFLTWVQDNHPDEVETVVKVRRAFETHIGRLLTVVDGVVIRKDTGEVVPWAQPSTGQPYTSVRGPEKDAAVTAAVELISDRLDELTDSLAPQLGEAS